MWIRVRERTKMLEDYYGYYMLQGYGYYMDMNTTYYANMDTTYYYYTTTMDENQSASS